MKKMLGIVASCLLLPLTQAQTINSPAGKVVSPALPTATPYRVVSRDANSAVWQRETYEKTPGGMVVTNVHRYVELATGLNFKNSRTGQWQASKEEIAISPDGTSASATNGQHQVYFPANIYNGVIKLVTPDGKTMESQPIGLSYSDGSNSVLLAVITNSIGAILPSGNQVLYQNAFNGLDADLLYTYTKAGMEQDVVLREQPPDLGVLGLNPAKARLQMLTEFISSPPPLITARSVPTAAGNLEDDSLSFGAMSMGLGKAFLVGANSPSVEVNKHWLALNGRQFLVEEVPIVSIAKDVDSLPPFVAQAGTGPKPLVSKTLTLPPRRLANTATRTQFLSQTALPSHGLVLDYQMLNGSLTNYVFQGDTTYFISGPLHLYVTTLLGSNIIEGGAVLKYATNASITIGGPMDFLETLTCAYRPAILTAQDDNSVGETISGSTGTPTNYYASTALIFATAGGLNQNLAYLRISYASSGIWIGRGSFRNIQFVNCQKGIGTPAGTISLRNVLFDHVKYPLDLSNLHGSVSVDAQNVTFSSVTNLFVEAYPPFTGSFHLINCALANVSSISRVTGDHNGFYNSPVFGSDPVTDNSYPFQTVGGGSYYLADDSPFLNAGTTNIDPTLLVELQTKTTYPPIVYSNHTFTTAQTFSPQAQRDSDTPDLGYHYDPLDYAFGGCIAQSNITVMPGTAIGWFQLPGSGGPGYGISLYDQVIVDFNGTVTAPCVWARYDTVQEGGNGLWQDKGWLGGITCRYPGNSWSVADAPQITARFTRFFALNSDPNHFRDYWTPLVARVTHCELYGGGAGAYNNCYYFTNCLFEDVFSGQIEGYNSDDAYILQNCTWHGGKLELCPHYNPIPIRVHNCAFDITNLVVNYYGTNPVYADYDYNAFTNGAPRFPIGGSHDITNFSSFNWEVGPLGNYYLPSNSPLIDAGDVTADTLGLYHLTTQTNEIREGDSQVDIGYHYVATSCGDAVADTVWVEDSIPNNGVPDGSWTWISQNPTPFSGALAHTSPSYSYHGFNYATDTLTVNTGDTLVTYAYLDPNNPPTSIMLYWYADEPSYAEGGVHWGSSGWGTYMGSLPTTGQWVRLEVPASTVGLEGCVIDSMYFESDGGQTIWDYSGKSSIRTLCYDTDGDGLPDYLEDANGNGVVDPGETDFQNPDMDDDGLPDGVDADPFNYDHTAPVFTITAPAENEVL